MPYAYKLLHSPILSHGFNYTVLYLDLDRRGFPHPVVPFHVNCYGSAVITAGGAFEHLFKEPEKVACPTRPAPILRFATRSARRWPRRWRQAPIAR